MLDSQGMIVFYAIALSFVLSQGLKIVLFLRKGQFHINDLAVTGGMPSSHSAVVTSLVLIIYLVQGMTPLFFATIVMAVIVIRDALGVRRTAGEEGILLNQVIKQAKLKLSPVHYALGHRPSEVAVGIFIGIMSALITGFAVGII